MLRKVAEIKVFSSGYRRYIGQTAWSSNFNSSLKSSFPIQCVLFSPCIPHMVCTVKIIFIPVPALITQKSKASGEELVFHLKERKREVLNV